jgi:CBS domain-containing protein
MRVKEVMSRNVECVRPDASLQDAAGRMKSLDLGLLPVCDNDRIVGMVTDRDITVRAVAEGKDPARTVVDDVMSVGAVYCYEDQLVMDAALLMREHRIRRLVVLNHDKRLVGIVSLGDLAVETGEEELVGSTLDGVCQASRHPYG